MDFHTHSRFSRACSKNLTLPNIARACEIKGIDIVSTADFTHPKWIKECEEGLVETSDGLFQLKDQSSQTRFILATEVACIFKQGEKTRRLHLILLAPSLQAVYKLNAVLEEQGRNLRADGRPILGISGKELLKIILDIDPRYEMIPAHAWTPWFAVFGSKSGFDSLEECFDEFTPHIHAIETGLSSDPKMNWQLSQLDRILLVSNSDAHSPENFGREANAMNLNEVTYQEILDIMRSPSHENMMYTIEFYPEEGKYHADGHRDCAFFCNPEETKKMKGECPRCKKQLTVGVLNRINELADRAYGFRPNGAIDAKYIVPLKELIASIVGVGKTSKKINELYNHATRSLGSEFHILLDAQIADIRSAMGAHIAQGIERMRAGDVHVKPGYDGEYGIVSVKKPGEEWDKKQMTLI